MAFGTFYSYTKYLSPYHKYLTGSLRIVRGFQQILEVETPECTGHNFHVTVVGNEAYSGTLTRLNSP